MHEAHVQSISVWIFCQWQMVLALAQLVPERSAANNYFAGYEVYVAPGIPTNQIIRIHLLRASDQLHEYEALLTTTFNGDVHDMGESNHPPYEDIHRTYRTPNWWFFHAHFGLVRRY